MLPYKYYRYYNRLDGNFWGKIWGGILGAVLYGANGFIALFIFGHFLFDTPNSRHARKVRKKFDHIWDNNWAKIAGAIIGFALKSKVLLFCGVVIGFFIDYYRVENANLIPIEGIRRFWFRINPLKLWRHSKEARHVAYLQAMAGMAAKIAKADGVVSANEIRVFKNTFAIKSEDDSKLSIVFNEAKTTAGEFEIFARQLSRTVQDNLELKENIIDNLFKIRPVENLSEDIVNQKIEAARKLYREHSDVYNSYVEYATAENNARLANELYAVNDETIKSKINKYNNFFDKSRKKIVDGAMKDIKSMFDKYILIPTLVKNNPIS